MKLFCVCVFVGSVSLNQAFADGEESLLERVLASAELLVDLSDTKIPYKKIATSKKYQTECRFNISVVEWGQSGHLFTFYVWFKGPENHSGSASSLIGFLKLRESDVRKILSAQESFEFVPSYHRKPFEADDPHVKVTVDGVRKVIEVAPIDDEGAFKENRSTYWYRIDFEGDDVVRVEKKHWQKTFLLGRKKLSFQDSCHFHPPS